MRRRGVDVADFADEWRGLQNGRLLEQMRDAGLGCGVTCDKNLRHQQNLTRWNLALVVLPKTRFGDLMPFFDSIVLAVAQAKRGRALVIGQDGSHEPF